MRITIILRAIFIIWLIGMASALILLFTGNSNLIVVTPILMFVLIFVYFELINPSVKGKVQHISQKPKK